MQKVLKRIGALPPLPQEEKHDIKQRAADILKSWQSHLDEISEMAKKDDPSKDKVSDSEKSPAKPGMSEDAAEEPAKPKEDEGEPMGEVRQTEEKSAEQPSQGIAAAPATEEKPAETKSEKPAQDENNERMQEDTADAMDGFVVVEGGGEADERAQEKATSSKEGDSSAGTENPKENKAPAPEESAAEPMGIKSPRIQTNAR